MFLKFDQENRSLNQQNRRKTEEEVRKKAAQLLLEDYQNDRELTVFTALDKEGFYETE